MAILLHNCANAATAFVTMITHSNRGNPWLICAALELMCVFSLFLESADDREDATARRVKDSDVVTEAVSLALATVRTASKFGESFLILLCG
jgi:hypothetical protein